MKKLQGIGVSPGIAIGRAYQVAGLHHVVPEYRVSPRDVGKELARMDTALEKTEHDLQQLKKKVAVDLGAALAEIINVQLLLLRDKTLQSSVAAEIKKGYNAAQAVHLVMRKYLESFNNIGDQYLKERRQDLADVARRLVRNLLGKESTLATLKEKVVLVAYDFSPSEIVSFNHKMVSAFVTDIGGPTSHTAIMTRALGIPAVVGLKDISRRVTARGMMVVDGSEGKVMVDPDEALVREYTRRQAVLRETSRQLRTLRNKPSATGDGRRIIIGVNLELPAEAAAVRSCGADGIGLFRTEFLYLNRRDLPSEEEQVKTYRRVVEKVKPLPVTIRTLDLGGDKFASGLNLPEEGNPFLGWRAIRFCLARPDIFRAQLKAILRAGVAGPVRLMYPLISDIQELHAANRILRQAVRELRSEGKDFSESVPVGVMVEVPSAALSAGILARKADFFSIGTNDLIQYALAVDRGNERTAYLYNPAHPTVLRLIAEVIAAGRRAGIPVAVCGEMASDPALAFLLVGMGIDELSMASFAVPQVKQMIRLITLQEARELAERVAGFESGEKVKVLLNRRLEEVLSRKRPPRIREVFAAGSLPAARAGAEVQA